MSNQDLFTKPESDEEFEAYLMSSDTPVVVLFFLHDDPKRNTLAPVFESLAKKFQGKILFISANGSELKETISKYEIDSYPTFKLFLQGEEIHDINSSNPDYLEKSLYTLIGETPPTSNSIQNLSTQNIPTQNIPTQNISTQNISTQNLPTQNISTQNISTQNISTQNIPTQNISTQNLPTQNISTQNIPTQNIPTQGGVKEINSLNEWTDTLNSGKLVVVDFFAVWCGPCKMISPQVEQLSYKYPSVMFVKVDVDKQKLVAQQCGISSMPTFQFYQNSQKLDSFSGANASKLENMILKYSNPSSSSVSSSSTSLNNNSLSHLAKGATFFEVGKLEQLASKLKEFSTGYCLDQTTTVKEDTILKIQKTLSNTNKYHSSNFSEEEVNSIEIMVKKWDKKEKFAALDFLRFFVLHPEGAKIVVQKELIPYVISFLRSDIPDPAAIMGLRFLANSFRWHNSREIILKFAEDIFAILTKYYQHSPIHIRLPVSVLLLNFSFYLSKNDTLSTQNILGLSLSLAKDDKDEPVRYHSICALGTMIIRFPELSSFFGENQKQILKDISTSEKKVKEALDELFDALSGKTPQNTHIKTTPNTQSMSNIMNNPQYQNMMNDQNFQNTVNNLVSNPQVVQAMQDPEVLNMMQQVMSDPNKMQQFASHPKFQLLANIMKQNFDPSGGF